MNDQINYSFQITFDLVNHVSLSIGTDAPVQMYKCAVELASTRTCAPRALINFVTKARVTRLRMMAKVPTEKESPGWDQLAEDGECSFTTLSIAGGVLQ